MTPEAAMRRESRRGYRHTAHGPCAPPPGTSPEVAAARVELLERADATRPTRRLLRRTDHPRHAPHPGGRPARLPRAVDGRGVRLRRGDAARLHRRADRADPAGLGHHADARPHTRHDRHDGDDAGSAVGRPHGARPRRLGAAGGRGLARRAVRQAAGAHARVHRDPAQDLGARAAARARGDALPHPVSRPGRDRAGQAAQEHRARTAASPSTSPPSGRRASRRPPRSPTAGCRSSTRPSARPRSTSRRSTRASARPAAARASPTSTSRSRRR